MPVDELEPARGPRGPSKPMIAILVATGVLAVLSVILLRCSNRDKPGVARAHWNAPPPSNRQVALADAMAQAQVRGEKALPGARLSRIAASPVDAAGMLDLRSGSATFQFVAGPSSGAPSTSCSIELVMAWQGWTQRLGGACTDPPITPRCGLAEVFRRGFPAAPEGVQATLRVYASEVPSGAIVTTWTMLLRDLEGRQEAEVVDDCP